MLKASALYMAIAVALIIGVLCSSLIAMAIYYQLDYNKKLRYERLSDDVASGVCLLLQSADTSYTKPSLTRLFEGQPDSVFLQKMPWGIYDIFIARSFTASDTVSRIFMAANGIDSSKWAALYLKDENRQFAVSGKTVIRGAAYLPSAGVQEAYIANFNYQGDKRIVQGKRSLSEKQLPPLNEKKLQELSDLFKKASSSTDSVMRLDSVQRNFLQPVLFKNFGKKPKVLKNNQLSGNIVLSSDTTITIDSSAVLQNIIVFAPSIIVKRGFHGNCQLFARDSIRIDSDCKFEYPSCLGIVRFSEKKPDGLALIGVGKRCSFDGTIFTNEKVETPIKSRVALNANSTIRGQIYAQGVVELEDGVVIDGSVFCSLFYYKNGPMLYENYLVNATIDSRALSRYFLGSELVPVITKQKKILKWVLQE